MWINWFIVKLYSFIFSPWCKLFWNFILNSPFSISILTLSFCIKVTFKLFNFTHISIVNFLFIWFKEVEFLTINFTWELLLNLIECAPGDFLPHLSSYSKGSNSSKTLLHNWFSKELKLSWLKLLIFKLEFKSLLLLSLFSTKINFPSLLFSVISSTKLPLPLSQW